MGNNDWKRYLMIGLGTGLLALVVWVAKPLIAYILISGVISLMGQPLVALFCRLSVLGWRPSRSLSAGLAILMAWLLLLAFFRFFIPLIVQEAESISNLDVQAILLSLQEPMERFQAFFGMDHPGRENVTIETYVGEKIVSLINFSNVSDFFSFLATLLGDLFIAAFSISFISFFFLKHSNLLAHVILVLTPERHLLPTRHAMVSINSLLKRYFLGVAIEVSLVILLLSLGMWLVGIEAERAIVIGFFAGVLNVIPYLGPLIGYIIATFLVLVTNLELPFFNELLFLALEVTVVFGLVHLVDNVLFQPLIYSSSVHAHPLEVFLVILLAGHMAGIAGMILAIPAYTILRVVAKEFFHQYKFVEELTRNI